MGELAQEVPLLRVQDATAAEVAAQLAVLASELPGFDNGDRAKLRRIAFALGGFQRDQAEALRLADEAVRDRAGVAGQRSRPEAVFLMTVLWLLSQPPRAPRAEP